jgi:alpha/beta superfamily hydrolase
MATVRPSAAEHTTTRVDPQSGASRTLGFFGDGPERCFGGLHLPAGGATSAVVICPSIHAEFERNYRREVLLSRALAGAGIASARFHYRGSGHSDGDTASMTLSTMREDAQVAAAWVRERSGAERVAFVGTRLGSLVAAAAAEEHEGAPVALWDPVAEPGRYFREAIRARLIRQIKQDEDDPPASGGALLEDLERTGSLEIMGYPISRALFRSAEGQTLDGAMGDRPRPVLLAHIARTERLPADLEALRARWSERGFPVDVEVAVGQEPWWFAGDRWQPEEDRSVTRTLIDTTARWLGERLR